MAKQSKLLASIIVSAYKQGRTDTAEVMGEHLEKARQEVKRHQTIAEGLQNAVAKGVQHDLAPAIMAERKRCQQIVMLAFGDDKFHEVAKGTCFAEGYVKLLSTIQLQINSGEIPRG